MKGMSLALETIVVLILSITVLTVLSFFFNKQFGEGATTIDLLSGQREACSAYVAQNQKCSAAGHSLVKNDVLVKLNYYCGKIGNYRDCLATTCTDPSKCTKIVDDSCASQCCKLYCPAGSERFKTGASGSNLPSGVSPGKP